jgi:hypothetical protein
LLGETGEKMNKVVLRSFLGVIVALSIVATAYGQCRVIRQGIFQHQNKRVRLVAASEDLAGSYKVIFFKTSLRVNTDGAPNSYHPKDLTGTEKAINNICNGVGVYQVGRNGREVKLGCARAGPTFAQFRDNGWRVPPGYRIKWENVIAPTTENGRKIPCVFSNGEFAGYFSSLTSLKNDLTGADAGQCGHKNQLDQRIIPAFVIPGGQNVVRAFGARVGDLLLAFNPKNNVVSVAVVGDVGPINKLGEGSVGLNMTLLGKTTQPTTYREALRLDTGTDEMLIAIISDSRGFNPQKPFTKENILARVQDWLARGAFGSQGNFVDFMKACNR